MRRITRVGTTISCYHGGLGTPDYTSTNSLFSADCYVSLQLSCTGGYGSVRFTNFQSNSSKPPTYTQSTPVPNYVSTVYDTAQTGTVTWGKFNFTGTVPTGTNLRFQVATSSSALGPWTFVGPDGTAATSGTALHTGTSGRYCVYKSYMTPNAEGTATPSFSAVSISYSLAGSNTSAQYTYSIDSANNITHASVTTDSGVSTDGRTPNNLNQILTQVVTPAGGGATTYTRTFNGDGTLATKTDGTNHWVYNWDPDGDQRLVSVVYNGTTQAAYTYDYKGRMLTRTVSGTTTSFEWENWTCIRETTSGAETRYYAPWGELFSFERGGVTYQVVSDALGSVRIVTDNMGAVVARLDYDPYGNVLSTSTDSVPSGMPYRYFGALGCRWDSATGLIYMRQRWYDPQLQRFSSRDPLALGQGQNLYSYVANNPINIADPSGLAGDSVSQTVVQAIATNDAATIEAILDCPVGACLRESERKLLRLALQRLRNTVANEAGRLCNGQTCRLIPGQLKNVTVESILKNPNTSKETYRVYKFLTQPRFWKLGTLWGWNPPPDADPPPCGCQSDPTAGVPT